MIIGKVYIKGQIGSTADSAGVELQDVVMQIESQKDAEAFHVHITSPGGSVNTGRLIATYLSKLDVPVVTIAETLCGSIATEIHLAVPVANRKIVSGTEYFIHNPLLEGVSGNATELKDAAAFVEVFEKEMLSMYVKATGAGKAAIEGLMKAETSLTDEQAKTLGFVSEVLPKIELRAVAFLDKKENKKNILDMTTIKGLIKEGFAELKASMKGEPQIEVKAAMVSTDNGELTYQSEGVFPAVDEVVMIGEEVAPEGVYTTEAGDAITVGADGIVSEVVVFVAEEEEETVEALKATIESNATAHAEALEAQKTEFEAELKTAVEEVQAMVASNYVPKGEKKVFNKSKKKAELTFAEKLAAKQALIAERKKA